MRYGETSQHGSEPAGDVVGLVAFDVRRVEALVADGWTWVEAVEAVAQDAPAARRAPDEPVA